MFHTVTPLCISLAQPVEGTEYVVMECIVLEGGDDVQLGPGEVVTLVRVEGGGASLRVRTTDAHPTEGTLPVTFLRKKTTSNGVDMEGTVQLPERLCQIELFHLVNFCSNKQN